MDLREQTWELGRLSLCPGTGSYQQSDFGRILLTPSLLLPLWNGNANTSQKGYKNSVR